MGQGDRWDKGTGTLSHYFVDTASADFEVASGAIYGIDGHDNGYRKQAKERR